MLGSITPLGERGRRSRWGTTVAAYVAGSVLGGVALGAALGLLGSALEPSPTLALWVLAALIGLGVAFDLGWTRPSLPTVRRQVNEAWLNRYRGWVYGAGFGMQLGAGVLTVVVISAVYTAFAAAFLSASLAVGAVIGAVFGIARAATVLPAARIHRPAQLGWVQDRIRRWERPAGRVAVACEVALAAACIAAARA